jgi:hypothetical protein
MVEQRLVVKWSEDKKRVQKTGADKMRRKEWTGDYDKYERCYRKYVEKERYEDVAPRFLRNYLVMEDDSSIKNVVAKFL